MVTYEKLCGVGRAESDQAALAFLETVKPGDLCTGVVADITRSQGAAVILDGFAARPLGIIGSSDLSWQRFGQSPAETVEVGRRISAEVLDVNLQEGRVRLSLAATENPELWAFLKSLRPGERRSGVVAAVERFGVFVSLDEGPDHPVFPGVGFITIPELSWSHFEEPADVVHIGQRITCDVLSFDTSNGEARMSLRAMQPDPFREFVLGIQTGRILQGSVTKLVPVGAFVRVADGIDGLIHLRELAWSSVETTEDVVQVGDQVSVVVTEIDLDRRRLALSLRQALQGDQHPS